MKFFKLKIWEKYAVAGLSAILCFPALAAADPSASSSAAATEEPTLRSFDVQATSISSYFIDGEKVKKEGSGDQVVYFVDLPNKVVKRIAVYYARKKKNEKILPGLYAKPQEYSLISYKHDFMKDQLIVKAMAQTEGADDGFETLVIGEDFVASSISAKGYFTVTYYERTDSEAMEFKRKHGKAKDEESEEAPPRDVKPARQAQPEKHPEEKNSTWFSSKLNRFNAWRRQDD